MSKLLPQLLYLVFTVLSLTACGGSGSDPSPTVVLSDQVTQDDPIDTPNAPVDDAPLPATAKNINRDNYSQILTQVLDVYRGAAIDEEYIAWLSANTTQGTSLGYVTIDNLSYEAFSCGNGGTTNFQYFGMGRGSIWAYLYENCQADTYVFNGKVSLWKASGAYNVEGNRRSFSTFSMTSEPGASMTMDGVTERFSSDPNHTEFDTLKLSGDYNYTNTAGTFELTALSTLVEYIDSTRLLTGSFTVKSPATGDQAIVANSEVDLTREDGLLTSGFSDGRLLISAEDGSALVLEADGDSLGDMFRLTLTGQDSAEAVSGDETWLENWSDWSDHLVIPDHL